MGWGSAGAAVMSQAVTDMAIPLEEQPAVTHLMGANTCRLTAGFAAGETPETTDEFSTDEEASVGGLLGRRRWCSRPRSKTPSPGPTARSCARTPSPPSGR